MNLKTLLLYTSIIFFWTGIIICSEFSNNNTALPKELTKAEKHALDQLFDYRKEFPTELQQNEICDLWQRQVLSDNIDNQERFDRYTKICGYPVTKIKNRYTKDMSSQDISAAEQTHLRKLRNL